MAGGAANDFDGDDGGSQMISGINVTPLVDITLVLLIIFMVTATYIASGAIKIDLPKAASGGEQTKSTLALSLTKTGALYLNGEKTTDAAVTKFIGETLPRTPDLQAIIAADKVVSHGDVVHVIDLVKRAGVRRFAINVDPAATATVPPTTGPSPAPTTANGPTATPPPSASPASPSAPPTDTSGPGRGPVK